MSGTKIVNAGLRRGIAYIRQEYVKEKYSKDSVPENDLEEKTEVDREDKCDSILSLEFDRV